jgi:hypothetical protein
MYLYSFVKKKESITSKQNNRRINIGKMHGTMNLKFTDARQAKEIFQYKNIKNKLYRTNAAIWHNNYDARNHEYIKKQDSNYYC